MGNPPRSTRLPAAAIVRLGLAGEFLRDAEAQETGGARNQHPHGKSGFS